MGAIARDIEDFEELVLQIVKAHIGEVLEEYVKERELKLREISLIERLIRVEEELKALRELETQRFEALQKEIDTRFEALYKEIDTRFEAMNSRFEALQKEIHTRFEAMNSRFEALQKEIDTRFEAMNSRFEALERRFNFLQWISMDYFSRIYFT